MFENTAPTQPEQSNSPFGTPFTPTGNSPYAAPNDPMAPLSGVPGPMQQPAMPSSDMGQDLHTMPERFLSADGGGKGGGKGGRGKVILIVVLAILILGAGGYVAYTQLLASKTDDNTNIVLNTNVNLNRNTNVNLNLNANLNANLNTNTNTVLTTNNNSNTNLSLNGNANGNSNGNLNGNLNGNTNTVSNTNTSTSALPLPLSKDTDGDGLSDDEELVFGTNAKTPDTDGDGFIDGKQVNASGQISGEVYLGYDPTQVGTRLTANAALVTAYTNSAQSYKIYAPTKWVGRTGDALAASYVITPDTATGEYFTINVESNPAKLSAEQWYRNLNATATTVQSLTINGLEGVRSSDGNSVYLAKADKVYIVVYNPGSVTELHFRTIFDVLVNNFSLVASGNSLNTGN